MCDCDLERPVFWTHLQLKAKKQHNCMTCKHPINSGEIYHSMTGKWDDAYDGKPKRFKMCVECYEVGEKILEGCYSLDDMYQELWDCGLLGHDDDNDELVISLNERIKVVSQHPLKVKLVAESQKAA